MKQKFEIPSGCKSVTVEQIGNQLITTFEPEKYIPKVGDVCAWNESKVDKNSTFCKYPIIGFFGENGKITGLSMTRQLFFDLGVGDNIFRPATELEKQLLFDELEKLGYVYDFETHTSTKKRWRAEKGEKYNYIDCYFNQDNLTDDYDDGDNKSYELENYFQTEQQAQEAADFLKKQLKEFNNAKK